MKYYIRMTNKNNNSVQYKQYKCIDGWNRNKDYCWRFSKQGALKIIERLKLYYYWNDNLEFDLEKAEQKGQSK